MSTLVGATS